MKNMLEMICAIPEEIGWTLVGVVATLCVMMAVKLGKFIAQVIKEHREDAE